jgi:hypothetical protein
MPKNLLCVALIVEAACWSTPPTAEPPTMAPIDHVGSRSPETCADAGERLLVHVCRRDDNLAWTITNKTDVALWAFVAPPAFPIGGFDRANAIAVMTEGHVVLTKMHPPPYGGETHPAGAVRLAPGESDTGVVPIGQRLNVGAQNFTGIAVSGTSYVLDVALEVAFVEARPNDHTFQPSGRDGLDGLLVLTNFDRKRQETVRSPAVRWP